MTLEEIADRLYALPPEQFTTARADAAKTAGKALAKQVGALRKPTVSAWIVNALARAEPALLEQLLALGPALAEAQHGRRKAELVSLGEQRRQLVGAVTRKAFEVSGRAPLGGALSEVEATLEAALADPASAAAVRSGRLVRPLSYAGFGEVDVRDAVAVPGPESAPPPRKAVPKRDVVAAEQRALDAAGALDDAVRACEQAHRRQEAAATDLADAETGLERAEQAVAAAREQRVLAEEAARKAARATGKAEQAVRDAQRLAEKTRKALDDLRRG